MYVDGYDFFNYTSDNALSLMHYMVEKFGDSFSYRLACDINQHEQLHKKLKSISGVDVDCFPYFRNPKVFSFNKYIALCRAKYIFFSETLPLYTRKKGQIVVFLNYFIPFKNDYGHEGHDLINMDKLIDYSITTSQLSSYIISTTYGIAFSKNHVLGFSRNDCLLDHKRNAYLDEFITHSVDYEVKHVILYTPTYRDYEKDETKERSLLGFEINGERISSLLRENGAIIMCKIHSTQNKTIFEKQIPEGIVVYPSSKDFGLCELMQRADCLITDYTSTYFDYILLNRPVLFNFYDYDFYKDFRGFSYDPLKPFLAGDMFDNEESFLKCLNSYFKGHDPYKEKRKMICDIHHKYQDSKSSERICNFFWGK